MAFFSQIRLMLWKNWILQRRRICVSIFEIVLPLLLAALLVILRVFVGTEIIDKPTVFSPEKIAYKVSNLHGIFSDLAPNSTIGFAPAGKGVKDVMSYVSNDMDVANNVSVTFKEFADESSMEEYAKNRVGEVIVCITFLNVGDDVDAELPRDLRYAVRPPTMSNYPPFHTASTYPAFQQVGPRDENTIETEKSIVLYMQSLVGEAFIKYWMSKNGDDPDQVKYEPQVQRMAYPPYLRDPMIVVVQNLLPSILIFSLIISVIINTKNLVYEKENKLKESMKLMGLLGSAHWVSWFVTFCIYLVPVLLLFAIFLCVPIVGDHGAILQNSDTGVVFLFLLAYGMATITFCFMVSSFVQKVNLAAALSGILFYMTSFPQDYIQSNYADFTRGIKLLFCLISNCGMLMGANIIGLYEGTGEGVTWSNFHRPATVDDNISLLDCVGMLCLASIIHLLIFWYLDNVRPGDFGVPQPYNFCFTRTYWFGQGKSAASLSRQKSDGGEKMLRFEAEPENLKAGIEIGGLTKVFGKKTAVDGVSLNMFEGQITVLLGHNGAGKTTTMSMLTGFIPPTSGTAIVNGYDITKDMQRVRSSLGLCPQHNILFDKLTVKEHLHLFAQLKGATSKEAEQEIEPLLAEVGLSEKTNDLSERLSGGQKRKLSVAIALIAGSKIVILDEPSSGMDPGARRQTWDVLQKHREGRTVLLTTHYMDEADVLGDRIAIMAEGVVKCCGTSMFLKKLYGTGYRLVIVKEPSCVVSNLTAVITSHIDTAVLESVINQEVTYLLPDKQTSKFQNLFKEMEDKKEQLGIGHFGTSATTMEEVFLRVGESAHHHDDHPSDHQHAVSNGSHADLTSDLQGASEKTPLTEEAPGSGDGCTVAFSSKRDQDVEMVDMSHGDLMKFSKGYQKNTGFSLEFGKMRGIFVKKMLHTWRHRTITLVQLILPVVFTCLALTAVQNKPQQKEEPALTLDLAPFENPIIPTTSGFNASHQDRIFEKIYGQQFGSDQEVQIFDVAEYDGYDNYTLALANDIGIGSFNKRVIVGLEMVSSGMDNAIHAISHYNGQPWHGKVIGVNYLMNALVQFYLNESYSLQSVLHPLPEDAKESADTHRGETVGASMNVALFISFGMAFLTALFAYYYIKERQVGAKHLQVVSGVSPFTYWLPSLAWDLLTYLVPCICLLIVFAIYDMPAFYGGERSAVVFFHLLMHGWAVLPFMYFVQFVFRNPSTGVNVIITLNILTGIVCLLAVNILKIGELKLRKTGEVLDFVFMLLFPNYCMAQGFADIYTNYRMLEACQDVVCDPSMSHPCCKDTCGNTCLDYGSYLAIEKPGIGANILIFICTGIFYFLMVFLVEYHLLPKLAYRIVKLFTGPGYANAESDESLFQDSDVANERERINGSTPEDLSKTDSLLMVNLFKKYGSRVVVDHMCLGIPKEECFGLLGQNGAGKTTTFKMLTGDVMVTGGNAYLAGNDVCNNVRKVQANMGYCPQFDALIDQMTGRETLTMYARLRGVPEASIPDVVNNLVDAMLLTRDANKLTSTYSGGNKRKLSTAISLVGMPDFIMLDEPSAGMDPKARRHLWTVLSQVRASGRTLILTSHSMEECDALCTRLAIMVNGKFVCLGSPQHLKSKFGEGYTLMVQLGLEDDGTRPQVAPMASYVSTHMPGVKVFDDMQGYVHFQVTDPSVKVSDVFGLMEATKQYFNVRDYSVHQTTLEQVFLTFTRTQSALPPNAGKQGCLNCF